jgi:hypothetical protein
MSGEVAVEAFRPQVPAALGVDELGGDAHAVAGFADAAFEHEAYAEVAPDLLYFDQAALVGEGGVAGDDEQGRDLREVGDQILGHAVAEIFLLGVPAHIGEREHGDRRFLRHGGRRRLRRGDRLRRRGDAKYLHRLGDILELAFAQILEHELRRVGDEIAHRAQDEDAARLGDVFQPRGDIHPVAVDVVIVHHYVAEIDADAEFDARALGNVDVARGHAVLHVDRAAHRFDRACELGEHAVAGGLD